MRGSARHRRATCKEPLNMILYLSISKLCMFMLMLMIVILLLIRKLLIFMYLPWLLLLDVIIIRVQQIRMQTGKCVVHGRYEVGCFAGIRALAVWTGETEEEECGWAEKK